MLDDQDPEFRRKVASALATPAHERTAEQIMLVAQLRPELSEETPTPVSMRGLEEGDPPWLRMLIGLLLFGLSLPLTPVLIRSTLHVEIEQLSFAGFIVLPLAWAAALMLLGFGYAGMRWLTRQQPGLRLFIDGLLVLLLVHTLYGWTQPAVPKEPEYVPPHLQDGERLSLWSVFKPLATPAPTATPPAAPRDLFNGVRLDDIRWIDQALASGVPVDARDDEGRTALMIAAARAGSGQGKIDIVRHLLDKGAAINLRDHNGETALTYARAKVDLLMLLAERGADPNLTWQDYSVWYHLRDADADAVIAIASKFPRIGLPIDPQRRMHMGPLHLFAERGDKRLVEYFLSRGLKASAVTAGGLTPLYLAMSRGNEKRRPEAELLPLVEVLLAAGADVNAKTSDGWSALLFAGPYPAVVERFIAAGADVNLVGQWYGEDKSVLDMYGNAPGAKVLRDAGAKTAEELRTAPAGA